MGHDEQGIGAAEEQDISGVDDIVVPDNDAQPDKEDQEVVSKAVQYIDKAELTQCLRVWRIKRLEAIANGAPVPDLPDLPVMPSSTLPTA